MLPSFVRQLRAAAVVPDHGTIVAGVSGGADSIALLRLLDAARREWNFTVVAAHLHHGLRGEEADADARFVQQIAENLGLKCFVERRDIPILAAAARKGIEETSREERYAFFERVCLQVGASVVALGHHADDQAETVLLRILRGTGFRGLAGMPAVRPLLGGSPIRVVRPLLGFTRVQLLTFLSANQIPFREDHSNRDLSLLRNRIRHVVMPLLEQQVNPQARAALLRLAEQAHWFEDYFHETVSHTLDSLVVSEKEDELVLNAAALSRKSKLLQTGLIREAYATFGVGEVDLAFLHLAAVAELLSDPASGKKIELPGGVLAEKRYEQLIFTRNPHLEETEPVEELVLSVPGRLIIPNRRLEISCELINVDIHAILDLRNYGGAMSEYVDQDVIRPPLQVRSPRPGDRFTPLGAPGSKTLANYFADSKISPEVRRQVVMVCDQLGPIWVVGHRIDDRVKLTEQTRRVLLIAAKDRFT